MNKESYEMIVQKILNNQKIFSKPYAIVKSFCLEKETFELAKNENDVLIGLKIFFNTEEEARAYAKEKQLDVDLIVSEKSIIV